MNPDQHFSSLKLAYHGDYLVAAKTDGRHRS